MNFRLTPDGARYLRMGAGLREPVPFSLRPLLPLLCGESEPRWIAANLIGIVAAVLLTGVLALQYGATYSQAAVASALLAGLPAIRFAFFAPVLVDMPAMALALAAAVLFPLEPVAALAVVAVSGLVSEKAPIFAAIFALEPLLLAGLAMPLLVRLAVTPGKIDPADPLAWTLERPLAAGRKSHAGRWRDPLLMATPWGACLAVLAAPTLWVALAAAAGYAQLLVATDSVRLYQQAAPVLCVSSALVIPEALALPALLAHWLNPVGGNGV